MLEWIGQHWGYGKTQEGSLMFGAVCFGYFFLLRASEYLCVGYNQPEKGLRGQDVVLKAQGQECTLETIKEADEVILTIRGSKTDIYNRVKSAITSGQKGMCARSGRPSRSFWTSPAVWGRERCFWPPVPNGWRQAAAKGSGASGYRSRGKSTEHAPRRPRNSLIEVWGRVSDMGGLWGKRPCEEMGKVGLRLFPNLSLGRTWSVQRYRQANGDGRSYPGLGPWRASRPDCIDGGKSLQGQAKIWPTPPKRWEAFHACARKKCTCAVLCELETCAFKVLCVGFLAP